MNRGQNCPPRTVFPLRLTVLWSTLRPNLIRLTKPFSANQVCQGETGRLTIVSASNRSPISSKLFTRLRATFQPTQTFPRLPTRFVNQNLPIQLLLETAEDEGIRLAGNTVKGINSPQDLSGKPVLVDAVHLGYSFNAQYILSTAGLYLNQSYTFAVTITAVCSKPFPRVTNAEPRVGT